MLFLQEENRGQKREIRKDIKTPLGMGNCARCFDWLGCLCSADQLDGRSGSTWGDYWFFYRCSFNDAYRSEERRVGKECRIVWGAEGWRKTARMATARQRQK